MQLDWLFRIIQERVNALTASITQNRIVQVVKL